MKKDLAQLMKLKKMKMENEAVVGSEDTKWKGSADLAEKEVEDVTLYDISLTIESEGGKFTSGFWNGRSLGLFVGVKDNYSHHDHDHLTFTKTSDSEFDTAKLNNAKIFRYPNLALPREKLNIISDKYGSSVIRDHTKADLLVISSKYLDSLYEHAWGSINYRGTASLMTLIDMKHMSGVHWSKIFTDKCYEEIRDFIDPCPDNSVFIITKPYYWSNTKITNQQEAFLNAVTEEKNRGYSYYVKNKEVDHYKYLLSNKDKVVFDVTLSKISTEDSVALDEDSFKEVVKMIGSSDDHDTSIGLEIMANCNVEESYEYIAMLLYFYTDKMKYCKGWNHVNFKTIRSKFYKYVIIAPHWGNAWPYNDITKKLCQDGHLTEFAVQVIAANMYKQVLTKTFGIDSTGVFKIDPSVLVLKDEYQKKLKKEDLKMYPVNDDLPF